MMSLYAMRCSPYRPTQMVMVSLDMLNGNVILMEFLALAAPDVVFWQLPVQPGTTISSKWPNFRFSAVAETDALSHPPNWQTLD